MAKVFRSREELWQLCSTEGLPVLVSPNELAATGMLSEYAVRKGIKEGTIPHIKIGRDIKINLTKFLKDIGLE